MSFQSLDEAVDRRSSTLQNGARVVTVRMPAVHRATVVVYARVGSRHETVRTNGLSHMVEHMIFRGSKRLPDATAYAEAIEKIGGSLYAETGIDYSLYQVNIPPDQIESAVELLGDVFTAPRFADLEIEKRIIREEILEDHDEDGRDVNVDNLARAAAWPNHPLGFRITGTAQNVARFRERHVRNHFGRFYGARNLVLCAAGAIDHDRALRAMRRAFRRIVSGRRSKAPAPPEGGRASKVVTVQSPGSQTSVEALWRSLPDGDPDFPALLCLMRIIDDGLSTRLHRRVVDELGLAYYVSAGLEAFEDAGALEVQAQVAHENAPRIVEEILRMFDELRRYPVGAEELDKAKHRYYWDLQASLDEPDAMAGWFGGGELLHRVQPLDRRLAKVLATTREDLTRVAARVFDRKRLTVAAVGDLHDGRKGKIRRIVENYS